MKTGMDRFKAQIVPMINAPAPNTVMNASGYHLSHKPYCPNYGSETTALVLEDTVFLVLDGDHRDDMAAASRSGGLQACFDLFLDRIDQANRLSEHTQILSGDDRFGIARNAKRILGEVNIDLLRAAATPSIPNHEELEAMRRTSEEKLGLPYTENTRFKLRLEYAEGGDLDPETVRFVEDIRTLEGAQMVYIEARDMSGLGASRFMPGDVFDEKGDHVARISYNGRLWRPEAWTPEAVPIAEAPFIPGTDETLIWMVGTRESVLEDAYTSGPDNSPHILKLHMKESEILVGKSRDGDVIEVLEKIGSVIRPVGGGFKQLTLDLYFSHLYYSF